MITVTMVIVMTMHGQDFERHEFMPSMEQCWRTAADRMEKLTNTYNDAAGIAKIGIGCVLNKGEPA
jgi:hypothetical protein